MKRNSRFLLLLTLLAGLLVTYEFYLSWQYNPTASRQVQGLRVYYTRDLSSLQKSHNLTKLLKHHEIEELPLQISTDCTFKQMYQSVLSNDAGILCINESQLWSDLTQRGVKINQLSDVQARSAIVSAVLEELNSRKLRYKEHVRRQFAEQVKQAKHNAALGNLPPNSHLDASRRNSREVTKVKHVPSFHESMVASFVKEAQNRPSDLAIPKLDSFYESHLPHDYDGLLPMDMKPKKPVKRPFVPLVVDGNQLNDFSRDWGNPFNNEWKRLSIPGIPPMPGRPPSVPSIKSGDSGGPKSQAAPPSLSNIKQGPSLFSYSNIPKMPDRPPPVSTTPPNHHSSLSKDLLGLKGYKFRENFDLIMRKLPTRFKYDGIRIRDRLKYIERAVNATDVVLRDVAAASLNPNILERAKVTLAAAVCSLSEFVCTCNVTFVG